MKTNILYVDDEIHNLNAFEASYRRLFNVYTADSAEKAIVLLQKEDIHIIITDQRMPKMTGVQFLASILPTHPHPIRMILTAFSDVDAVIDAINKGQVYRFIQKPWNEDNLRIDIEKAAELYNLRKENRELTQKLVMANQQLEFIARQNLLS
jgi:response regulator RpfG family c-di-GMP phosphodiesterase